jgi:hypothetical protein
MTIKELRLLPPLAFARFGSSPEPQANYNVQGVPEDPLGFRRIVAGPSLIVTDSGAVSNKLPDLGADPATLFRDREGRIRPVAPFFELYAITDGEDLEPVTLDLLAEHKTPPIPIQWAVHVENRKVFRRTGDPNDIVAADTGWFSSHDRQRLYGDCVHFDYGTSINFGMVQFVLPNNKEVIPDNKEDACSQFRLRFTPGRGRIYGPLGGADHRDYLIPIYKDGRWAHFDEKIASNDDGLGQTLPPSLYAIEPPAPPWLHGNRAVSRGYLDEACDGFIYARMKLADGTLLQAKARICVGPPAFVPDALFVRSLADDLDQVLHGMGADDIDDAEANRRALDVVHRACEAVRFMNVAVMNGNPVSGRVGPEFDTMPAEESFGTERSLRPVMPPNSVDTAAILALHQQVYAALSAGTAPWFARLLRRPGEIGDLTDRGRRKMPALMSGADSYYLALTHRQIATIAKAATRCIPQMPEARVANAAIDPTLSPRNLTAQLRYNVRGNPVTSRPEIAVANCCPGLEVDFRAVWRRLFEGIQLREWDNYVVEGRAIDASRGELNLKGHRLLSIDDGFDGQEVIVTLEGPSASDPDGKVPLMSKDNPDGVWTMEWSNCLAHVINGLREHRKRQEAAGGAREKFEVECVFTGSPAEHRQRYDPEAAKRKEYVRVKLAVRDFFEPGTAVISEELAQAGELTQGLCSPWQNDLRECSCYYWASSRPDFVNTYIGRDGLTHGDNWFAKTRTGEYVPDDYVDPRLVGYDDLFRDWEQLQFQIGGKDAGGPRDKS